MERGEKEIVSATEFPFLPSNARLQKALVGRAQLKGKLGVARGPGCKRAVHAEFVASHRGAAGGHHFCVPAAVASVVVATAALTIFMAAVLIPRSARDQVFSASYVEVLAADDHGDYTDLLK